MDHARQLYMGASAGMAEVYPGWCGTGVAGRAIPVPTQYHPRTQIIVYSKDKALPTAK